MVVGGGVIGCAIAWHLQRSGAKVTLLERGRIGDGASSAAAGMLAPFAESSRSGPFADLATLGLDTFVRRAEELRAASGIDFQFHQDGILRVAETTEQAEALQQAMRWQNEAGAAMEWLDQAELADFEPGLASTVLGGVYSPSEGQVNPALLVQALASAATASGTQIIENCEVQGFRRKADGVSALLLPTGELPAEQVVLAGGAWSAAWCRDLGHAIPLYPVRGQMVALSQPLSAVRHIVYSRDGYLVPKADGSVFVGATEEETAGFDSSVTAGGLGWLLAVAGRLAPRLAQARMLRAWAGLRPGTADHLPLIGSLPGLTNVTLAAGHFRNGILLSLITGELVAQQILQQSDSPQLAAFAPARLTRP
jgi:glycine oxidase